MTRTALQICRAYHRKAIVAGAVILSVSPLSASAQRPVYSASPDQEELAANLDEGLLRSLRGPAIEKHSLHLLFTLIYLEVEDGKNAPAALQEAFDRNQTPYPRASLYFWRLLGNLETIRRFGLGGADNVQRLARGEQPLFALGGSLDGEEFVMRRIISSSTATAEYRQHFDALFNLELAPADRGAYFSSPYAGTFSTAWELERRLNSYSPIDQPIRDNPILVKIGDPLNLVRCGGADVDLILRGADQGSIQVTIVDYTQEPQTVTRQVARPPGVPGYTEDVRTFYPSEQFTVKKENPVDVSGEIAKAYPLYVDPTGLTVLFFDKLAPSNQRYLLVKGQR